MRKLLKSMKTCLMLSLMTLVFVSCGNKEQELAAFSQAQSALMSSEQANGEGFVSLRWRWEKFLQADSASVLCGKSIVQVADSAVLEIPKSIVDSALSLSDRLVEENNLDTARMCVDLSNEICDKLGKKIDTVNDGWLVQTIKKMKGNPAVTTPSTDEIVKRYPKLSKAYVLQGDGFVALFKMETDPERKEDARRLAHKSYKDAAELDENNQEAKQKAEQW